MRIINYKDWSNYKYQELSMINHIPEEIVIHHSEIPRKNKVGGSVIRSIQNHHIFTKGWVDIGYHFLIDDAGDVYAGREVHHVGAHCRPNTGKIGVCVIGNYDEEFISEKSYESLVKLLIKLNKTLDIDVINIKGHRDYDNTKKTCPGENLYNLLPDIRLEVRDGVK